MSEQGHPRLIAERRARHQRQAARPRPKRRGLPSYHVNMEDLGLRIASAPSRAGMARPYPKSDYLEGAWKLFNDVWSWAHGVGSSHFDATWPQLQAKGNFEEGAQVERSLRRYAAILEEIGLVRIYGVKDANGAWQRLDVELLQPPPFEPDPALLSRLSRRSSSVG